MEQKKLKQNCWPEADNHAGKIKFFNETGSTNLSLMQLSFVRMYNLNKKASSHHA